MKLRWLMMLLLVSVPMIGCAAKEDPTKREGFVDTSDPGNFGALQIKPPGDFQKPEGAPAEGSN